MIHSFYTHERLLAVQLTEVSESSGLSTGVRVAVVNASHTEQLLGNRRADDTGTTRRRDEAHEN